MAAFKAGNVLITGANRGLGFEMVKQLLEVPCPKWQIFAGCRDPDGPKSEALRELVKKHPSVITIIDVADPCSIKESAKKVGSLLGKNSLNMLVNNAAVLASGSMMTIPAEDMQNTFNTNVMGPLLVIREYLPYLQTAAKARGTSGMSCDKAAVINISSTGGSITSMPSMYTQFPVLPYSVSKAGLNMLTALIAVELKPDEILCMALHPGWVRTDMGGEEVSVGSITTKLMFLKAPLEARESVEGMLRVISSLTENEHGGFMDYTGQTLPW
ncbi:C-factor-like isoform X2 [Myxocyprinus asiaticus]|uniref:C-factor-like isoform X2 n=1 Tax=Myxocyprinus asiaticus TaxID=70543 RepID=UPI002222C52D|nr:C-factor-like isoform X2 [Myxocyprinus asiaticus]